MQPTLIFFTYAGCSFLEVKNDCFLLLFFSLMQVVASVAEPLLYTSDHISNQHFFFFFFFFFFFLIKIVLFLDKLFMEKYCPLK